MSKENEGGIFSCPVMCWIVGALLGLATYLILSGRFDVGMVVSIVAAIGVFVVLGALMRGLFCNVGVDPYVAPEPVEHDVAADPEDVVAVDNIVPGDLAMPYGVPEVAPESAPSASLMDNADSVARKEEAIAEEKPAAKPKPKPAAKPKAKTASAKPKAKTAAKPAAKKKTATKAASKPARKPVAKDGKPEFLKKPRAGGADDLKQIKGVGPKLEKLLNTMGVFHFDQVAGWRAKEVKWVDEHLEGFKGRVSRDEWVKQAKILAKGGKTEFSKKVEKGGVYAKNKK